MSRSEKRVVEARAVLLTDLLRYTAHRPHCAHRGEHSTDCRKWDGFHENRFLNDSRNCTCDFGRPCNCGLSAATKALLDILAPDKEPAGLLGDPEGPQLTEKAKS